MFDRGKHKISTWLTQNTEDKHDIKNMEEGGNPPSNKSSLIVNFSICMVFSLLFFFFFKNE